MKSTLVSVDPIAKNSLDITFTHVNLEDNYSVNLEENSNKIWRILYMENGILNEAIGKVKKIIKYEQRGPQQVYRPGIVDLVLKVSSEYKITFDTSDDFEAGSVTVDARNLRALLPVETIPCPDPDDDRHRPIHVPKQAFNFIKLVYPDKYMILEVIPNQLITDETVDASSMFTDCTMLKVVRPMTTKNMVAMNGMFYKCSNLVDVPMMDTSRVTTMSGMFGECSALQTHPNYDTRNVRNFTNMYDGCSNLINLPELNMSSAVYTDKMFRHCSALEDVSFTKGTLRIGIDFTDCKLRKDVVLNIIKNLGKPLHDSERLIFDVVPDIENIENFKYVFTVEEYNNYLKPAMEAGWLLDGITWDQPVCPELITDFSDYASKTYPLTYKDMTYLQLPNTSEGTTMENMFANCLKLMSVPEELVTPKCLNMSGMFMNCLKLINLPYLDTSKVVNMNSFCYGCNDLVAIPKFNTSKVTSMKRAFANCMKLNTVPEMDFSNVVDASEMFFRANSLESFAIKFETLHCSLDISNTKLNKASIIKILDAAGSIQHGNEINFIGIPEADNLTKDEWDSHVVPAMNKGWNIKGIKQPEEQPITNFIYYMRNNYPSAYMTMETCPELPNTSEALYATGMFEGCERMLSAAQLYMPKLINGDRMFYGCINMVNFYDMESTITMQSAEAMFYACTRMIISPKVKTTKVVNFNDFFNSCQMLTAVSELDMSSALYTENMFKGCTALRTLNILPNSLHCSVDVSDTDLSKENLLNLILNLGDPIDSDQWFKFNNVKSQNDFTEDEIITYIKPAIEKGWNIECDIPIDVVRTDYSWYMKNTLPHIYTTIAVAPELDIKEAKYTDHMYDGCAELTTIPGVLDMSNVIHAYGMFAGCNKLENITFTPNSIRCNINFSNTSISKTKVLEILDCLGTPLNDSVAIVFTNNAYDISLKEWEAHAVPAIEKGWKLYGIYKPQDLQTDFSKYLQKNYPDTYKTIEIVANLPDTSAGIDMSYMFADANALTMITAIFDTANASTMLGMFMNCVSLVASPTMKTTKCKNFANMFYGCTNLVYIQSELDFSFITEETSLNMFKSCNKLQYLAIVPGSLMCDLDLSDTILDKSCIMNIIKGLAKLPNEITKIIKFNEVILNEEEYAHVTTAIGRGWNFVGIHEDTKPDVIQDFTNYMKLTYPTTFVTMTSCPEIDTSQAINMRAMFEGCLNIENIVPLHTANVTNMNSMFAGCMKLRAVPELDMISVSDATLMFANCSSLTDLRIKPLSLNTSVDFGDCPLSIESIYNILDNLKAINAPLTLSFADKVLNMDEFDSHVAPAMAKGWTILGLRRQARTNFNDYMKLYYPETYQSLYTVNDLESTVEAITMNGMFKGCMKLAVAPTMITNKVVDMREMFAGCTNLAGVQVLSMSSVKYAENMFKGCVNLSNVAFTPGTLKVSVDFSECPLTRQVVLAVIKNAAKENIEPGLTLRFKETQVRAVEYDTYVVPALDAGWQISGISVYEGDPGDLPDGPTGLQVYAADVITDPDHRFVTDEGREKLKDYLTQHDAEYKDFKEVQEQEAEDQDIIEDTLQWKPVPTSKE